MSVLQSKTMPRSSFKVLDSAYPHFVTSSIVNWIPLFRNPDLSEIVLNSLRYLQRQHILILYGYVIMEDHIHLIIEADDVSKTMRSFKSYTARKIIDHLMQTEDIPMLALLKKYKLESHIESTYQVWQEGFHPILLKNSEMMLQKIKYIHDNPVRKGLIKKPEEWKYSSASNYLGMEGLISVKITWY